MDKIETAYGIVPPAFFSILLIVAVFLFFNYDNLIKYREGICESNGLIYDDDDDVCDTKKGHFPCMNETYKDNVVINKTCVAFKEDK